MQIFDTHCHLYLDDFANDQDAMMERAKKAGVQKFYLPAIDSHTVKELMAMEEKYPGQCMAMMGLHPCSVKENYKEELCWVEEWLCKRKFAAIGEIGLDFYWDKTFSSQQYEAFCQQMEWGLKYDLPIVIHTRNAMDEAISEVRKFRSRGIRGIFHCFGGSMEQAIAIIEMGFYLGIGGVVTYKKAGLDEVLKMIDPSHLVLETDAPYLTPVPFRGKRNESGYLTYILQKLSEIYDLSVETLAGITSSNAQKIFGG